MQRTINKFKVVAVFVVCFLLLGGSIFVAIKQRGERVERLNKIIKVGITTYQENDEYIDTIMEETQKVAKEYEKNHEIKININIVAAKGDQGTQNKQVEKFISLGYDVICVNAVDRTNVSNIVDQAIEGKIPLIFFNREPVEDDLERGKHVYYIGSNAKVSAIMQGEMIAKLYKEAPELLDKNKNGVIEYAMLEGEVGHQDAIIRTEWSVETMKKSGLKVERVISGVGNWMRDQGAALAEQWMQTYPGQIELIIGNNDAMALGALDTLSKFGINNIPVVGIDGIEEGIKAVDEGRMIGTVQADIKEYANCLFDLSFSLATKGEVSEKVKMDAKKNIWISWNTYMKQNTQG